jgi:hypothetical protein
MKMLLRKIRWHMPKQSLIGEIVEAIDFEVIWDKCCTEMLDKSFDESVQIV